MYFLLAALIFLAESRLLTQSVLLNKSRSSSLGPVDNSEFIPQVHNPTQPANQLDGFYSLTVDLQTQVDDIIWSDPDPSTAYPQPFNTAARRTLPAFNFEYVLSGSDLLPINDGVNYNLNPTPTNPWEWILQPSRCWHESTDGPYVRCVLLFALAESQQNCLYNGFATFLVHPGTHATSNAWVQITNSYCAYYQFNKYAWANVTYMPNVNAKKDSVINKFNVWQSNLFPTDSILSLPGFSGTLEANAFNNYSDHGDCSPVPPYGFPLGAYGVLYNGTFYTGISATRSGAHPYPKYVVYPMYSASKSNYASLLLGALDLKGCVYPKSVNSSSGTSCVFDLLVSDWINEADSTWSDTKVRHLLDQATNHYNSLSYGVDEGNLATNINFFYSYSTAQKLNYSLYGYNYHPELQPGSYFVYHTTNEFLLSYIYERLIQKVFGKSSLDFYKENVCDKLHLSNMHCKMTMTPEGIPFGGYGMYAYQDDVAKLANFWTYSPDGSGIVSQSFFMKAMQLDATDRGLFTHRKTDPQSTCYPSTFVPFPNQRYHLGFWSDDTMGAGWAELSTPCTNNKLVFESAYGGGRLMIAKNAWTYWQWNDNYDFKHYRATATLANTLGCPEGLFLDVTKRWFESEKRVLAADPLLDKEFL